MLSTDDPLHDDMELWSPSDSREEQCLFGRQVSTSKPRGIVDELNELAFYRRYNTIDESETSSVTLVKLLNTLERSYGTVHVRPTTSNASSTTDVTLQAIAS